MTINLKSDFVISSLISYLAGECGLECYCLKGCDGNLIDEGCLFMRAELALQCTACECPVGMYRDPEVGNACIRNAPPEICATTTVTTSKFLINYSLCNLVFTS